MSYSNRSTTKPLTGTVFYVLLALAETPKYGLGIVQEVERQTGGEVKLGPGTLYNIIKKMLETGLIEEVSAEHRPMDDDPRRRYYGITEDGRFAFESEASRLASLVSAAKSVGALKARP